MIPGIQGHGRVDEQFEDNTRARIKKTTTTGVKNPVEGQEIKLHSKISDNELN